MKTSKKIFLGLLIIIIVIQFIHPAKNQDSGAQPNDVFSHYPASDTVQSLVRTTCYDCHSNNTQYPWYSKIQPVDWWLTHHVNEGKGELNWSEFGSYNAKKANHKLEEVADELKEKAMPLSSYTLIHHDAKLTDSQRELIIKWTEDTRKRIIVPAE